MNHHQTDGFETGLFLPERPRMIFKKRTVLLLSLLMCQTTLFAGGHDQLCVQVHFGHPKWNEPLSQFKAIKELGVGWIRDDLLWRDVEPKTGHLKIPDYVWRWLKEAKKHDIKVIAILNGSNKRSYEHPFDEKGYANFARFCARELKGYVHAFELINEPFGEYRSNISKIENHKVSNSLGWDRFKNQIQKWPMHYVSIMNKAADAIEDEAPNQYKIIGLGCVPPVNAHMIKMGISSNVDGQVMHPYSYRWIPELLDFANTPKYMWRDGIIIGDDIGRFYSIMKRMSEFAKEHNGPKEIWLTEQGYTTYKRVKAKPARQRPFTEHAQAVYGQRRFMECLGLNIRLASWYTMRDRVVLNRQKQSINDDTSSEGHFGLMRQDGTLKPAYYAIQRVAIIMKDWKADPWTNVKRFHVNDRDYEYGYEWAWVRRPDPGVPESRAYTFSKNGKRAIAIWSAEQVNAILAPRTADTRFTSDRMLTQITAMDMMSGETWEVPFNQTGQEVVIAHLPIPDHPLFLKLLDE